MYYSAEKQKELLKDYRENDNKVSLNTLIMSNKNLVIKEARDFAKSNGNIDIEDLIQEGYLGLSIAANKFDFNKDVSFVTYASYWIKQRMRYFVASNKSIVRLGTTADGRKIFSSLARVMKEFEFEDMTTEQKIKKAAKLLDVKEKSIRKMMNVLKANDLSLNKPTNSENEGKTFLDTIMEKDADNYDVEFEMSKEKFCSALAVIMEKDLDEEEHKIINDRFLSEDKKTYDDLAKEFRVSRQYIRTKEEFALKKLKSKLNLRFSLSKSSFFDT